VCDMKVAKSAKFPAKSNYLSVPCTQETTERRRSVPPVHFAVNRGKPAAETAGAPNAKRPGFTSSTTTIVRSGQIKQCAVPRIACAHRVTGNPVTQFFSWIAFWVFVPGLGRNGLVVDR
jgi:hypothetical protein